MSKNFLSCPSLPNGPQSPDRCSLNVYLLYVCVSVPRDHVTQAPPPPRSAADQPAVVHSSYPDPGSGSSPYNQASNHMSYNVADHNAAGHSRTLWSDPSGPLHGSFRSDQPGVQRGTGGRMEQHAGRDSDKMLSLDEVRHLLLFFLHCLGYSL